MKLEKILADLQGIRVFETVNHIKGTFKYPSSGIKERVYHSYISREWGSDDYCPGQGGGDWYEAEKSTIKYLFIEKSSGKYSIIPFTRDDTSLVDDIKVSLEAKGHDIAYILKREEVHGPTWESVEDTVYFLGGVKDARL